MTGQGEELPTLLIKYLVAIKEYPYLILEIVSAFII